jgi:hypothetical protein
MFFIERRSTYIPVPCNNLQTTVLSVTGIGVPVSVATGSILELKMCFTVTNSPRINDWEKINLEWFPTVHIGPLPRLK